MDINKIYNNYGTYIVEQGVIAKDINSRLLQYLEDDDIRQKITDLTNELKDGNTSSGTLTNQQFKFIDKKDTLAYEIDKKNPDDHKVTVYIKNIEQTSTKIDFNAAAYLVHQAVDGMGTDEETIAAVGTALSKISYEDGQDSSKYFDMLDEKYTGAYGESLTDAIEGDLSGNAEVIALSIYRRKIEDSVLRGIDIENVIADLGLTISTFGGWGAVAKAARLGGTAGKVSKALKPVTTGIKGMISRLPGFSKLSSAAKLGKVSNSYKVGQTVTYTSGKGNTANCVIKSIGSDGVTMTGKFGGSKNPITFTKNFDDFVKGLPPKEANKVLSGINNNKALLTLTGKKLAEAGADNANTTNFAEIMGWYSTVTANPEKFTETIQGEEMSSLARRMHDLSNGVTTMGDELSMALIVTSLRPDAVKKLNAEYAKLSTNGKTMLQDLESETAYFGVIDTDATTLIRIYVKGMLGGDPKVNSTYSKLKK